MKNTSKVNGGLATSFTVGFWLAFDSIANGIALEIYMGVILAVSSSFGKKEHNNEN